MASAIRWSWRWARCAPSCVPIATTARRGRQLLHRYQQTFVGIWQSISSSFFAVFVSLAAISLVVGGIVIMNIMLVSVTERTREIGVRKALGARRGDVMLQFLIESATMSLVGGLIGVIGGIVFAKAITLVIGFPSDIELWSVLLGLFVATAVGIFFGVYPARKAVAAGSHRCLALGAVAEVGRNEAR